MRFPLFSEVTEEGFAEVPGVPCLIEGGEAFESDVQDTKQRYAAIARNLLRHIIWGTPIRRDNSGLHYQGLIREAEHAFLHKRDRALENAVREQLNMLFRKMTAWLTSADFGKYSHGRGAARYEIFLAHLLTLYPYFHPENNEVVHVPQRINQQWIEVEYRFRRIDISPQKGLMAAFLEENDRIYAYAMHPQEMFSEAVLHLLFSGTVWPTGQGAILAWLHNFCPYGSAGESHDMTEVNAWFAECEGRPIHVAGQSKGGVVAMLVAARFPLIVRRAVSVSPTALSQDTLERLTKDWLKHESENRAEIHVFAQANDPVTWLEAGYLPGTHLWHVNPAVQPHASYVSFLPACFQSPLANHLQYFIGREGTRILKGNVYAESRALHRLFLSDVKKTICSVMYPFKYLGVCTEILVRRLEPKDENCYRVVRKTIRVGMTVVHYTVGGSLFVSAGMMGAMYSVTRIGIKVFGNLVHDYLNVFRLSRSVHSFAHTLACNNTRKVEESPGFPANMTGNKQSL